MTGTLMPTPDRPRPNLSASLPALRARLEEQRRFRIEQLASLEAVQPFPVNTPYRRGGSGDSRAHREITAALTAGARQALSDIETALYRMRSGRYGTCLRCGSAIPLEHLVAVPEVTLCPDCARARRH